jgi:hypothetical protein
MLALWTPKIVDASDRASFASHSDTISQPQISPVWSCSDMFGKSRHFLRTIRKGAAILPRSQELASIFDATEGESDDTKSAIRGRDLQKKTDKTFANLFLHVFPIISGVQTIEYVSLLSCDTSDIE